MDRPTLIEAIVLGIQSCTSAKYEKITNFFNTDEIYDFANTIAYYLPTSLNSKFEDIESEILNVFADKKHEIVKENLYRLSKKVSLQSIFKDEGDIEKYHLIFFLLMYLKNKTNVDVESILNDITSYYKSLLLPADQLKETVNLFPNGTSYFNNKGGYVRIDELSYKFTPSITTLQNFKYLIYGESF